MFQTRILAPISTVQPASNLLFSVNSYFIKPVALRKTETSCPVFPFLSLCAFRTSPRSSPLPARCILNPPSSPSQQRQSFRAHRQHLNYCQVLFTSCPASTQPPTSCNPSSAPQLQRHLKKAMQHCTVKNQPTASYHT